MKSPDKLNGLDSDNVAFVVVSELAFQPENTLEEERLVVSETSLLAERLKRSETVPNTDDSTFPVYEEAPSVAEAARLDDHRPMREGTFSNELGSTSRSEKTELVTEPEEIAGATIDVEKVEVLEAS